MHSVIVDGPDYQALPPEAKLVWWTLKMSCGAQGIAIQAALVGSVAERTGYDEATVYAALTALVAVGWIERERNVVWLVRGLELEPAMNIRDPKHRRGVQKRIAALPNLAIVDRFCKRYAEWFTDTPYGEAPARPSRGPRMASSSKETETETDTETETSTKALVALRAPGDLTLKRQQVRQQTDRRKTVEAGLDLAADVVFGYWRDRYGHEHAILDPKRRKRIIARLRENGGDVGELLYALDGGLRDDWTMGRDKNSTKRFDGIETLLRDRGQVEKFLALVPEREAEHPFLRAA